jgi:hypothetical protein
LLSVCVSVYPLIVTRQRLLQSPLIVARQRLGKNPPIVARQRPGKNPLIVARQRLGKNLPIVAKQRLSRNVTAVTNTHATIEELLDASFVLPRTSCIIFKVPVTRAEKLRLEEDLTS